MRAEVLGLSGLLLGQGALHRAVVSKAKYSSVHQVCEGCKGGTLLLRIAFLRIAVPACSNDVLTHVWVNTTPPPPCPPYSPCSTTAAAARQHQGKTATTSACRASSAHYHQQHPPQSIVSESSLHASQLTVGCCRHHVTPCHNM